MKSNVIFAKGVDEIRLGMYEQEIRRIIGIPDRVFFNEYEPYNLVYNQYRYRLSFSSEGGVLESIEVGKSQINILGCDFTDYSYDDVINVLNKFEIRHEIEDFGYNYVIYTSNLYFEFEFEKLINVVIT